MATEPSSTTDTGKEGHCIVFSLQTAVSHLRASDGKEIPFSKAILGIRNACESEVVDLSLHISLGQEGGTSQDVTHALSAPPKALPPDGHLSWDVYDLLLPAHSGTSSKVHMFGYRAVLNWQFDLAVWASYRRAAASLPERTPPSKWVLRWHVADASTGTVELAIGEGKG